MGSSDTSNKWKDALLRSSLPLEHLIAQKLGQSGIYVSGEFTYLRPNENGVSTEFSTDLWAFTFLEENAEKEDFWSSCNFVIECKYTHRSVKWIFSPHPLKDDESFEVGYINTFQDLCVKRIDRNLLYKFDEDLNYCIKGIELQEKDCNPSTISKGLRQLQYAAVQLSKRCMSSQICTVHDEELEIVFLCPILVTTAPLYVIKQNLGLDDFYNAEQIEDVAEKVNSLIVHQDIGIQQDKYIENLSREFCDKHKEVNARLKDLDRALKDSGYEGYHMPDIFFLKEKLGRASTRILVVNYDHFETCLDNILEIIKSALPTLKRYAVLKYDNENKKAFIDSL
jgi:hypothetical protein